jgi:hypothetical protein
MRLFFFIYEALPMVISPPEEVLFTKNPLRGQYRHPSRADETLPWPRPAKRVGQSSHAHTLLVRLGRRQR